MTSYAVLIKGFQINIWKYYEAHNVEMPKHAEEFRPLEDLMIFVVETHYDSNDFEDYSYYRQMHTMTWEVVDN